MEDKPKKKEISAKRFPDSGEDEVKDPDLKPAKDAKGGGGGGGTRGGGAPLGPGGDPTAGHIGNK